MRAWNQALSSETMPSPILPRNIKNPTFQGLREIRAFADFARRIDAITKGVKAILNRQQYRVITLNAAEMELKRYQFNVDTITMDLIGGEIADIVDRWLMEGGERDLWFLKGYVQPAYQQGTSLAFANLSVQSEKYRKNRSSLQELLSSPAYRTRLGYVRAREFEEMKGFTAGMKSRLQMLLTDGMSQGMNPNDIAKQITASGIADIKRAKRIARTEITTALKRARLDEAEATQIDLGLLTKMMQISALSATTRPSHAARHARLFTIDEVRVWMSTSPNMINCKCSFVEVLVNEKGEPLTPGVVDKAKALRR